MAPKAEEKMTDNQRKVFDFFVERFKSQEPFTKKRGRGGHQLAGQVVSDLLVQAVQAICGSCGRQVIPSERSF
jgi:hypothetical protein